MDILIIMLIYIAVSLVISLGAQKAQTGQQKKEKKEKCLYLNKEV